jgi:ferredoxin--NADP+ reductase
MNRIVAADQLSEQVVRLRVEAPRIARKRKPGQFVLVRMDEHAERVPLTIADADPEAGTITLIIQVAGHSTLHLSRLKAQDAIRDVVGPLGHPTHIENFGTAVPVGGGIGTAVVYPIARALREAGNHVIGIIGARTKELVILEEEMRSVSDELIVATDDGSYGYHGFVTQALQGLIDEGRQINFVAAVGPVPMMRATCNVTRPYGIKTIVSLNPIMMDGTGMCGGCRVSVGGETKFACVDGPEFDGHQVDFDELVKRQSMYIPVERKAFECLLEQAVRQA